MWYKYFNKESWNLRIWRNANLKFNQDDFGMFRHKYILRWKDFVFRACRTEGALRGSMFFYGAAFINILIWAKSTYYDPVFVAPAKLRSQKDLEERDAIANKTLFFNKFGAPTRPMRSLDDMITFLAGSGTYDQLADFVSYNAGMDINMDMQKGLDSWMGDQDKQMLKLYQATLKKSH